MARGFDHIVHAARDLDALAALYRRLGFTVGARNKHAWGTHNAIVQFDGVFVELLCVGEPEKIVEHAPRSFSFGAFNRDFLARHEGIAMLVLEGHDVEGDVARFAAAGIGDFAPFHFEREGKRPDGTTVKVAFSLAFARDLKAPEAGFFTCQHHHPENFWNPTFQQHDNTATGIAGIVLVAADPAAHGGFLSAFTGAATENAPGGLKLATPRGAVEVLEPGVYQDAFGAVPPDVSHGARFAALRFAVRDMGALDAAFDKGGIVAVRRGGRCIVAPSAAFGAGLIFEQAEAA